MSIHGSTFTVDGVALPVHWHNLAHPGNFTNATIVHMHQNARPNRFGDGEARAESPDPHGHQPINMVSLSNGVNFSLPIVEGGMLFLNHQGNFTKVASFPYDRVADGWRTGAAAFADVDGDGDVTLEPSRTTPSEESNPVY